MGGSDFARSDTVRFWERHCLRCGGQDCGHGMLTADDGGPGTQQHWSSLIQMDQLDSSFGHGTGIVQYDAEPSGTDSHFTCPDAIALDAKHKFVLAGTAGDSADSSRGGNAVYGNAANSIRRSTAAKQNSSEARSDIEGEAFGIAIDRKGKIHRVGHDRKNLKSFPEAAVFRLNSDGTPDKHFGGRDGAILFADQMWGVAAATTSSDKIVTLGTTADFLDFSQIINYGATP